MNITEYNITVYHNAAIICCTSSMLSLFLYIKTTGTLLDIQPLNLHPLPVQDHAETIKISPIHNPYIYIYLTIRMHWVYRSWLHWRLVGCFAWWRGGGWDIAHHLMEASYGTDKQELWVLQSCQTQRTQSGCPIGKSKVWLHAATLLLLLFNAVT